MNTATTLKTVELEKFLIRASAIIKALGYVSNSEVKGTDKKSTAMLALDWADDFRPTEIINVKFDFSDKVIAKEVAEWMEGIDTSRIAHTDYLFNLAHIGVTKTVTEKTAGYAASAIKAFEKEKNKNSDEKKGLEEFSAALGKVGGKLQGIKVLYVDKSAFQSRFGLCFKYQFEDGAGHKITWMTGTDIGDLVKGGAYTLEGTIKEFSTYRGKHECQVTRAKVRG